MAREEETPPDKALVDPETGETAPLSPHVACSHDGVILDSMPPMCGKCGAVLEVPDDAA